MHAKLKGGKCHSIKSKCPSKKTVLTSVSLNFSNTEESTFA